ncbi:MAG: hypothetical protein N2053_02100 [Chitinispirillaceae bacterium]|nr:hypothetical protein [Chitinispirillaceae bacterium]
MYKKVTPKTCEQMTLLLLVSLFLTSFAEEKGDMRFGVLVMVGGRYDNLRMCVASPKGVKGGMIADIMFTGSYALKDNLSLGINLPVMRPILFALAFKMLQFEPEFYLNVKVVENDKRAFMVSPSAGVSLHYGPDYNSDRVNRSPSFFAAGPILGCHLSMDLSNSGKNHNIIGLKPFYAALFSTDKRVGTVVGGVVEYQYLRD